MFQVVEKMFIDENRTFTELYSLVWPCVALCGLVWPCVALCGLVWPCVAFFGLVWSCVALFGLVRPYVALCDLVWSLWQSIVFSLGHRSKLFWSCF